jgi:ArsR family transcriptional regulator, arsenate/arsenite/antimonite-responsive transcriptional repressor
MDEKRALTAIGALAQATRLQLFRLLVGSGADGVSAGVIAERLGVIPSSLSFHLTHSGLVTQRRKGRQMFYAADPHLMRELVDYLAAELV